MNKQTLPLLTLTRRESFIFQAGLLMGGDQYVEVLEKIRTAIAADQSSDLAEADGHIAECKAYMDAPGRREARAAVQKQKARWEMGLN